MAPFSYFCRMAELLQKFNIFCSLLDTGRSGAYLCGGKSPCNGQSLYKRKNGFGYPGIQVKADESKPHQPEVPP